jgi:hypothetical protein
MKRCSTCQEEKPFEEFHKWKNGKDGCTNQCKVCKKAYYYKDHEGMKEKLRARYAADPNKVIEAQRTSYSTVDGRKRKILIKAKEGAKKRGLEFSIGLEDIVIPAHCPYLGVELTHDLGKGQLPTNSSIDRIDSTKGYVKGNVQIISRLANTMKNNATDEQLKTFAVNILKIHR